MRGTQMNSLHVFKYVLKLGRISSQVLGMHLSKSRQLHFFFLLLCVGCITNWPSTIEKFWGLSVSVSDSRTFVNSVDSFPQIFSLTVWRTWRPTSSGSWVKWRSRWECNACYIRNRTWWYHCDIGAGLRSCSTRFLLCDDVAHTCSPRFLLGGQKAHWVGQGITGRWIHVCPGSCHCRASSAGMSIWGGRLPLSTSAQHIPLD
jgi:hypothetical protein